MKRLWACIAFLIISAAAFNSDAGNRLPEAFSNKAMLNMNRIYQPDSFFVIFGKWKATRFINGDASAMPDDKFIKATMDKIFLFAWRMSVVLSDTCVAPIYDAQKYNKAEFLSKYLGQESDLGIKGDSINIARIRCAGRTVYRSNVPNNYYYRFIIVDDQSLIMPFNGNFLLLNRVNEKSKPAVVAVDKPLQVKEKEPAANKPAQKTTASSSGNWLKYGQGNFDPFHIFTDMINSAALVNGGK